MTLAADPDQGTVPHRPDGQSDSAERPVEFWSTSDIRTALENDDIDTWQRIVVALKRDPYGRTARQVEEVLEGTQPYGISKALSEVLVRTRAHLETNERAEVARHIRLLMQRSGLSRHEFASRLGVSTEDLADYLDGEVSPPATLMIRIRRLSDRFVKQPGHRSADTN